MKKVYFLMLFGFIVLNTQAQTEKELISETITAYFEGTANGESEKLKKAFHPDFNLYAVNKDNSLKTWEGKDYVGRIKPGKKSNRIGKIIAIDFENNVATAKAEVLIPNKRVFTDYFLLVKYEGSWKIIHKSYTWRAVEK